jgi:hypothetical protein
MSNETSKPHDESLSDALPLSLLNDFLYCPRRAALKMIEGWWVQNIDAAKRR